MWRNSVSIDFLTSFDMVFLSFHVRKLGVDSVCCGENLRILLGSGRAN